MVKTIYKKSKTDYNTKHMEEMMKEVTKRVCKSCGRTHNDIVKITDEEVDELRLLDIKIQTSESLLKDGKEYDATAIKVFLDELEKAKMGVTDFWIKIIEKYDLYEESNTYELLVDYKEKTVYYD